MKQKEQYLAPHVEVVEMENEGVIASSVVNMPNNPWGGRTTTRSSYSGYNASSNDLEDMINDILTVGN